LVRGRAQKSWIGEHLRVAFANKGITGVKMIAHCGRNMENEHGVEKNWL